MSRAHWMVGLSPIWGKFVSAKNKSEEESFSYLLEHYAHTVTEIGFSARFNWFWNLMDPSVRGGGSDSAAISKASSTTDMLGPDVQKRLEIREIFEKRLKKKW